MISPFSYCSQHCGMLLNAYTSITLHQVLLTAL
jgi:hypothetical protein